MTFEPLHRNMQTDRHRYVLAIDLGSGGHKIALVSDTGHVVASASEKIATLMLPGGGAEQDPDEWIAISNKPLALCCFVLTI